MLVVLLDTMPIKTLKKNTVLENWKKMRFQNEECNKVLIYYKDILLYIYQINAKIHY